ncbi:UDP-N-acetylglucosamine--peptide N-acetylglucosaminyltransferase 110 kDa subunit [Symbiodinium microadriaticum]|uniref:UDP-N-acetylglucosamine--peptide N-acetylglucosaminyltransferase 110 kDa subunit n=1 Tax=Symbiodinium microadriaticum TaxID=2951 RepID=A0A1Q9F752_SYMMI|nr:UDP-N-acetylglucosamine--peptide N-acetylglucosaminyltransferase 110 kDa subunit [Symbiodinium microadriaticum]
MFVPATLPSLARSCRGSCLPPWRQELQAVPCACPSFRSSLLGVGVGLRLVRFAKPRGEAEPRSRASEVQKLFQTALSLTDEGLTDEAVSVYRRLLELDPSRPEPFLNLGLCLASQGEEAEALEAIDKALAIDDRYDDAHYNRGLILDEMGMVEDALASFGRAEESAMRLGEVENAAQYSAAIGLLLLSEQRYSEALAAYDRAISQWPGSADFWTARGEALCELGRFDDALASQRKALDLCAETDPGLLYNLALTYAGMGDVEGCGDALQKALDADRMQVLAISQNFAGDGELFAQRRQEEAAFLRRRVQETEYGGPERERWERLEEVVASLRRLEEDPLWLRDRLLDSSNGRDQTAYGSTWFESWCQLVDAGALHCTASAPQQMVVFGSSIGWQCFLGHLHLGHSDGGGGASPRYTRQSLTDRIRRRYSPAMKSALLACLLGLAGAVELTKDNWDEHVSGKTVFVKFLAPW